jgi:hypothetical protein
MQKYRPLFLTPLLSAGGPLFLSVLSVFALPTYEPFSYTAETDLVNLSSPAGLTNTWYAAGASVSGTPVAVVSGSLAVSGLGVSQCNSVKFGGLGPSARLNLTPPGQAITSGSLYFSLLLRVTDLTGLDTTGGFVAGFNNSLNAQANTPTMIAPRVMLRAVVTGDSTNGFNVGMTKSSALTTDWAWDPTVFDTNQTIFLVGRYQFNPGDGFNDLGILWINPDPATYGAADEPQTGLNTTAGADLGGLASFVLLQRSVTNEPAAMIVDELRFGTTWAFVTATDPPAPTLSVSLSNGTAVLSWTTNVNCFTLEQTPALSDTWTSVTNPAAVEGMQYVVQVDATNASRFYRLRSP